MSLRAQTQAAVAVPATHRKAGSRFSQPKMAPYLFLAPYLILFAVFGAYPILKSLWLSLHITAGPKSSTFVGLGNYQFLLTDPDFHKAVWNTAVYAFWSVFLQLPLALGLAILLTQHWLKGRDLFRLAFFSSNLVAQVFVGVIFNVLFIPKYGLINIGLANVSGGIVNMGLGKLINGGISVDTKWLSDSHLVMPALVMASLWLYVGFNMIYFLAALQSVDKDLYEASLVDGATGWTQFRAVTLPAIRPVAIFVLLTATLGSFQLFELPYVLLGNTAGPDNSGLTVLMYLFNNGFVVGDLGYASAVGWTLAFAMLIISLAQVRLTRASEGNN